MPLVDPNLPKQPLKSQVSASLPKKEAKKNNSSLLLGVLLVLLGVAGYLVYPKITELTEGRSIVESQKKVQIKDVDWKQKVFENPVFQSLKPTQEVPLDTNLDGGNPSPFVKKVKQQLSQ